VYKYKENKQECEKKEKTQVKLKIKGSKLLSYINIIHVRQGCKSTQDHENEFL